MLILFTADRPVLHTPENPFLFALESPFGSVHVTGLHHMPALYKHVSRTYLLFLIGLFKSTLKYLVLSSLMIY